MSMSEKRKRSLRFLFALLTLALGAGLSASVALAGIPAGVPLQGVAPASQRGDSLVAHSPGSREVASPPRPDLVLYDQYDHDSGNGSLSANIANYPDLSSETADDFVVPGLSTWTVNEVDVAAGAGFSAPGSFNVVFYLNSGVLPGTPVYTATNLAFTGNPDFIIPLVTPASLSGGTYWVSVVGNGTDLNWFWEMRTAGTISGNQAAWRNPGDGYATGCTDWGNRDTCMGMTEGDQMFRLLGSATGPTDTPAPPTATATCVPDGAIAPFIVASPAPLDVYGAAATSDGTYAYIEGGYSSSIDATVNQFRRYNPATDSWARLTPMPDAHYFASSVYSPVNNKIYVFGGDAYSDGSDVVLNTTRIYDMATGAWTTGLPMPDIRSFMSAGYYNGKIYLVGGYNTDSTMGAQSQVWEYDPLTDTFNTSRAPMPRALGGAGSGIINGHLYVAGGRDINNAVLSTLYDYDIAADSWTEKADLPGAVNGPGSAVIHNTLWIFGGGNPFNRANRSSNRTTINQPASGGSESAPDSTNATYIYTPTSDSWAQGPPLNTARSFPAGTNVGNYAVAVGGVTDAGTVSGTDVSNNNGCDTVTATSTVIAPTATATAAASATCPPVEMIIGPDNPGKPVMINQGRGHVQPHKSAAATSAGAHRVGRWSPNGGLSFVLDDGTLEDAVHVAGNGQVFPGVWINRFSPAASTYPFTLNTISIQWPDPVTGGDDLVGKTVDLLVYLDADGDGNPANAVKLAQISGQRITIADSTTFQDFPVSVLVPGPGDVYIGFADTYHSGGHGSYDRPAGLDTDASQGRSYVAGVSTGADPDYNNLGNNDLLGTIDSFGLPGNWVIRASGTGGAVCGTVTVTPVMTPSPTCQPPEAGAWTRAPNYPYPEGISRYAFAQDGNNFYVISGYIGYEPPVTNVSVYNSDTGIWTALAPIPTGSESGAAAAYNGKIYVAPGLHETHFYIYDISTNIWSTGPAYPGIGYGEAAGAYNDRFYVVGGGNDLGISRTVYIYDIAAGTWSTGPDAPSPFDLGGYNTSGQYLYMIGTYSNAPLAPGGIPGSSMSQRTKAAAMPQAPAANGGESMRLDMATGTFSLGPAYTMHRADFGLAVLGNTLYAMGGDSNGGGFFDSTSEVDSLDVTAWPAGTWRVSVPDLPTARQGNQAGFSSAGKIWSTGGFTPDFGTVLPDHIYRTQEAGSVCPTSTGTAVATATTQATSTTQATGTAHATSTTQTTGTVVATETATACTISFSDVPQDNTFYANIECLACKGIISGYDDGTFRPNNQVTRGQIAKIVSNSVGYDDDPGAQIYTDVPPSNPFYSYINRLTHRNVMGGYECGTIPQEPCDTQNDPYFRPGAQATRGQISKIISNAAGIQDDPGAQIYTDVPPSNPFYSYINRLTHRNVMGGYECGTIPQEPCDTQNRPYFRWGNNTTRGQASKIDSNTFFPNCNP